VKEGSRALRNVHLIDTFPCHPAAPSPAVLTTLQVATVAVAITVGTSLLVGADVDSGSMEGLQAFAAALDAQVAAGAVAAQVRLWEFASARVQGWS